MSVAGVTSATRTALANAITTGGLTCLPYDEWDGRSGLTATLGAASWDLGGSDQRRGIYAITFTVLVYQSVGASASSSISYQETALEDVIDGLSADPTLGSKVAFASVEGEASQEFYSIAGGAKFSVVSVPVRVTPFSNAA